MVSLYDLLSANGFFGLIGLGGIYHTWELIERHPDKLNDYYFCQNPNITWDIIDKHPEIIDEWNNHNYLHFKASKIFRKSIVIELLK